MPIPANIRRWPSADSMLGHNWKRWASVKSALDKPLVLAGMAVWMQLAEALALFFYHHCHACLNLWTHTRQTQNICITLVQCWPNVFDVGPALCKCYTDVLILLGIDLMRCVCNGPWRSLIMNACVSVYLTVNDVCRCNSLILGFMFNDVHVCMRWIVIWSLFAFQELIEH